ncbi:ATP-binding protein [Nocardia sp. NPDC051750]|uniref:ATP-binding protein n=1 Tax=Nocardia sp. NPDC051750 TaxID=3364325 RepID=UPI0037B65218
MRYFNTTGPCDPELHYMVPAIERLPQARQYITFGQYFVVHAPRQTGKTTTLAALARQLTSEGEYLALHFSCEVAESAGADYARAERAILDRIRRAAEIARLPAELMPPSPWPESEPGTMLGNGLAAWVEQCPRRLVLFFDEIDAVRDASLISVLRQLRDGFTMNRRGFVHSVVLCGLRDVRDYKAASGGDPTRLGTAGPFNIKVKSFRIGDFTRDEVATLYGQHTAESGQEFTSRTIDLAFHYSQGQPWLVNALAAETTIEMQVATSITEEHIEIAKERLILARATHLDSLAARLAEPRVRRVIEPLLAGGSLAGGAEYDEAVSYVRDLGLITSGNPVRIANPIYHEVIARVLTTNIERDVLAEPSSFRFADGRLDMRKLLDEFASFWKLNGDSIAAKQDYHEIAPHLIFMAFLQRVVNGGGYVDREYGVGRGRIDLLVRQPYTGTDGIRREQREAIELKIWPDKQADPVADGAVQLGAYLDLLELQSGTLVIFDRRTDAASIVERTRFDVITTPGGHTVTLLRA